VIILSGDRFVSIAKELAKKDFIVFSGAGVPQTAGVPTWISLLKELLKLTPSVTDNIDTVDPEEFPNIAQKIFESLRQQNKEDEYYNTIRDSIKPTDAPYSGPQFEIVTTTNWIVTTNFDTTFESAFKKKLQVQNSENTPNIQSLPDFRMENLFTKESIVYLHGRVDEKFIIFKTDEYENFYPSVSQKTECSKELEDYLKYIFKNYTIVFIGFSFVDRYIKEALKNIYSELKRSDTICSAKVGYSPYLGKIRHYAFLKSACSNNNNEKLYNDKLDQELESLNIKVVRLDNYIDWIRCFEDIQKFKQTYKQVTI